MKLLRIFALFFALVAPLLGYDVTVTGRTTGSVWGTGIYTNDSDVATAAVHAGLIANGQTATITVTPLPGQSSYTGSTANGVSTFNWGSWPGSISLALAAGGGTPPVIQLLLPSGVTVVNGVLTAYTGSEITANLVASDVDADLQHVKLMRQGDSLPLAAWTMLESAFNSSVILTTPSTPTTWVLRGEATDLLTNTGDSGWYTIQIVTPISNEAPTASIAGPTSLTTGQNGTWNYSALDANANLYRWRLVVAGTPQSWNYISGGSASSSHTTYFSSPGTYTLTVEVEDTDGATGSASTNVAVSNPPINSLPYTVSSSYSSHVNYPSLAPNYTYLTDGSHTNNYGYGSDTSAPNWLMADFGSTMRITQVHVGGGYLTGWGYASGYSSGAVLQYSNDATNWTTAHTYSSGFSTTGTTVILDIVARYWRIYRSGWLGTTEFRFEGTADGTPTYTVNVVNGTTNGQASATATEGTSLPIVANAPPANYLFSQWTKSGPGTLANAAGATTSFTVGNGAATVTANYVLNAAPTASISAAGATTIPAGSTATILYSSTDANANLTQWRVSLLPNSAQWTTISGESQSAQFNYTFPTAGTYTFELEVVDSLGASATAQVVFTVQAAPTYTLTVNGGTGSASGLAANAQVAIQASPPAGMTFSHWTKTSSDSGYFGNANSSSTTYTLAGANAVVQANFVASPVITAQPQSQTVTAGANVTFSVSATGTPAPTYQWRKNGTYISGATQSSYTLTSVNSGHAGYYSVVVTNAYGSVESSNATLTVTTAPAITTQPLSQTVTTGANVNLTVVASGSAPLSYQWKKNGTNISGATSSTLGLNNVQSADAGSYTVVVANSAGSATSSAATLVVNASPVITTQPQNQTVAMGGTFSFTVVAGGSAPLSYQWRKNGSNISGATSATYTRSNAVAGDAGSYTVVVSNSFGSVTSSAATLTVTVITIDLQINRP